MAKEIISGSRTSFGPRTVETAAMAKLANTVGVDYVVQEANGDNLQTWTTALDATEGFIPANSFIANIYYYANTAIAGLGVDVDFVKVSDGTATGPAVAIQLAGAAAGAWAVVAVNATVGTVDAMIEFGAGVAASEKATILVEFYQPLVV